MKTIPAIIISLVLMTTTHARIHETYKQCVERYGAPIQEREGVAPAEKIVIFKKSGYQISACFIGDKVEQLIIKHIDGSDLSYESMLDLAKANSEGSEYGPPEKGEGKNFSWRRADKQVIATYLASEFFLVFRSLDYIKAENALKQKKEDTSGF